MFPFCSLQKQVPHAPAIQRPALPSVRHGLRPGPATPTSPFQHPAGHPPISNDPETAIKQCLAYLADEAAAAGLTNLARRIAVARSDGWAGHSSHGDSPPDTVSTALVGRFVSQMKPALFKQYLLGVLGEAIDRHMLVLLDGNDEQEVVDVIDDLGDQVAIKII